MPSETRPVGSDDRARPVCSLKQIRFWDEGIDLDAAILDQPEHLGAGLHDLTERDAPRGDRAIAGARIVWSCFRRALISSSRARAPRELGGGGFDQGVALFDRLLR